MYYSEIPLQEDASLYEELKVDNRTFYKLKNKDNRLKKKSAKDIQTNSRIQLLRKKTNCGS